MAMQEDHQFDRRVSDVNMAALSDRMKGLEGRVTVLEEQGTSNARNLESNTMLTKEVHEAVFGVEGEFVGIAGLVKEIYGIVETGKSFFRAIGSVASGAGKSADWVSRMLKRFWWLIAFGIAVATYIKTGKWELPLWPG